MNRTTRTVVEIAGGDKGFVSLTSAAGWALTPLVYSVAPAVVSTHEALGSLTTQITFTAPKSRFYQVSFRVRVIQRRDFFHSFTQSYVLALHKNIAPASYTTADYLGWFSLDVDNRGEYAELADASAVGFASLNTALFLESGDKLLFFIGRDPESVNTSYLIESIDIKEIVGVS